MNCRRAWFEKTFKLTNEWQNAKIIWDHKRDDEACRVEQRVRNRPERFQMRHWKSSIKRLVQVSISSPYSYRSFNNFKGTSRFVMNGESSALGKYAFQVTASFENAVAKIYSWEVTSANFTDCTVRIPVRIGNLDLKTLSDECSWFGQLQKIQQF